MEKVLKVLCLLLLPLSLNAEFIVKSYQELKNQKVVRQNYEQSCGASSLATLLNLIDKKQYTELDLLKVMSQKELYTDMVSFADLKSAIQTLGYEGQSYKIHQDNLELLIQVPLLVKIEDDPRFPHFVVIINQKGNYLEVLDPSHGSYISSKSQFFSIWDRHKKGGFALVVVPKAGPGEYKLNIPSSKVHFEKKPFKMF
ncbi:peptidase C39 [Helicobacter monodelphidis]|uniref:C39 family peptidase n=1 Tax=Helicobacter sp. 15-1451 TaxID=2004995 RepID=UPI000DCF1183|nr:cysteine peptidase family C39 domain-containing protein [Helicobacter sp. 15-1451]RAX56230.1 peptidase C39 [Helicobacter sp. 15-1451]